MKLSVIIVNYNVKYFLQHCLHAVIRAGERIECEIWVVDNNSYDGSVEMVRELFPTVKVIANTENTGFAKANNQAIRNSSGKYILLLNPDTLVEEDTFEKVCRFMDEHNDAGALGVHMIDGSGNYLPESKRGLPTPMVAFYKISGLSALFPRSTIFGRYHLGFLDKNKTHCVDVLSGAFMLLRKETLDKTGLLDEDYFMYGEDIDLSYRITQAGYKNYYYPGTKIIHYKGESTKKSSVNYVLVFYKAMGIFARKHLASGQARLFNLIIQAAIWARAGLSLIKRLLDGIFLPLFDFLILYGGMLVLSQYWQNKALQIRYPELFFEIFIPLYCLIWMSSMWLSGAYDQPSKLNRIVRGILSGTLLILVAYALLPETLRFSRALILMGTAWASFGISAFRYLLHLSGRKKWRLADGVQKRFIIVGDADESQRVLSLLMMGGNRNQFIGFVNDDFHSGKQASGLDEHFLGSASELSDLISVYRATEVIFCGKSLSSAQIIEQMLKSHSPEVDFKIAPPESYFIVGSNSMNEKGEFYLIDISSLNQPEVRRKKRLFDLLFTVLTFIASPFLVFMVQAPGGLFANLISILGGSKSWVGDTGKSKSRFSGMKPGVIGPEQMSQRLISEGMIDRLYALYAKDYRWSNDWYLLIRNYRHLGN